MALSNYERVGRALDVLKQELEPFVLREMKAKYKDSWYQEVEEIFDGGKSDRFLTNDSKNWDIHTLLTIMQVKWFDVFSKVLGKSEKNIVFALKDQRNNWAHQQTFSTEDAYRVFDNVDLLLQAISSPESSRIGQEKQELLRIRFNEQARKEARKKVTVKIKSETASGLKPWREVITPHPDVANGSYNQAEFAADLWEVFLGRGSSEYLDPVDFYQRTFLTNGLNDLIENALKRLSGKGGEPVIELQTNFGGGKTHSMLALYHLFSGVSPNKLIGIDALLTEKKLSVPGNVNRVVIVGNKIPPGKPDIKNDGTVVNTLWGEIAYQLGGKDAYEFIAESDRSSTNPGDALKVLFEKYAPCLILIDEWVAYARGFYTVNDLPAGTFDTQFTFAQTLSESVKNAAGALLVVSVPASDNEIGGEGGQESLNRLKNAIGRVHHSWAPATAEEGFEIVRKRLFQQTGIEYKALEAVVRAFSDLYQGQAAEFPAECKEADYRRRLERAYPIHPDLFEKLYSTWSSLDRFQRTRGVLRLMASVIYSLWSKDDRSLMILSGTIPIDDPDVKSELTRYLTDNWKPVIDKDVDGEYSLPRKLDDENTNLGKYSASRRVARAIYMGSAPLQQIGQKGIEEKEIKLGCVQPGEYPATFGDALRRLSDNATFLYVDNKRFWYSTQPTVRKLAEDRAGEIDTYDVWEEIRNRVSINIAGKGDFEKIHCMPNGGADIADEPSARLVVIHPEKTHLKNDDNSPAISHAKEILENRGTGARYFKNTIVFLAADETRLKELNTSVRKYLAWQSILNDKETLNLSVLQIRQGEEQRKHEDDSISIRLVESFCWLIYPYQSEPKDPVRWTAARLQGNEPLAVRAAARLKNDGQLVAQFGGVSLRIEIDKVPLWRGNHILLKQIQDDFFQYTYLPRLKNAGVLLKAVADGVQLITWKHDSFAYAEAWDADKQRYKGLKAGQVIYPVVNENTVIVKPDIAQKQLDEETKPEGQGQNPETPAGDDGKGVPTGSTKPDTQVKAYKRFWGTVQLDPLMPNKEIGKLSEEVIQHLSGLVGSEVVLKLDIDISVEEGIPEDIRKIVMENCNTLKIDHGFEEE
ncbi:MAG: DUF499 domain-containing protein [Spirochaetia bacterium]